MNRNRRARRGCRRESVSGGKSNTFESEIEGENSLDASHVRPSANFPAGRGDPLHLAALRAVRRAPELRVPCYWAHALRLDP